MYTTSRQLKDKADKRFVLQLIHVVVIVIAILFVSGCDKKPLTAKQKNANYWKNVKELGGTPKGQLLILLCSTIAVFTAFRKYIVDDYQFRIRRLWSYVDNCTGIFFTGTGGKRTAVQPSTPVVEQRNFIADSSRRHQGA